MSTVGYLKVVLSAGNTMRARTSCASGYYRLGEWMCYRFFCALICCALIVISSAAAHGCFYSSYSFSAKSPQRTNLDDLLFDRLLAEEKERGGSQFYVREAKELAREYPTRRSDPAFLNDYAYVTYMSGNLLEALRLWEEARKIAPNDYQTLCNLATAYHLQGKFDEAISLLKQATKLRPNFRYGAEELHIRLLEHLKKQREDPHYITRELLLPELTPAWEKRHDPPNRFQAENLPKDLKQGLTELLKQFPKSGDIWFVLAMLLESSKDYRRARLAYQKALKTGCGKSEELQSYMKKYMAFEESRNPIHYVGRMFLGAFILTLALFFGARISNLLRDVIDDIRETRKNRSELANKHRNDSSTR